MINLQEDDHFRLNNNTTLHFALSLVVHRGRLASRQTFGHLRWPPGTTLAYALGRNYLLLQPKPDGELTLGERGRLLLPADLLHYCGINTNRQVLLIAASDHDMLVVHPQQNIAEMVRGFHEAQFQLSTRRRLSLDHH